VVDKNGMAVTLTSTINLIFGSEVLDPETGIILNDEMDDFSTPGIPNAFGLWSSPCRCSLRMTQILLIISLPDNYPEPGKRPLSSTVPAIIEHPDGSFFAAIGGSGGSRIFGAVFQTLLNLDLGLDVSQAVEFGRLHDQLYPLILDADSIYPPDILDALRSRGHNVTGAFERVLFSISGSRDSLQFLMSTELPPLFKRLYNRMERSLVSSDLQLGGDFFFQ
jgi:gamma-glutamyltranspeptidase/glutathione hydrolase/leukotriene-C4 hydrolase